MVDPVSIAGTAVGVVSLGLQVSQGLIEYYTQWRDFDADVATLYASVVQLDRLFRFIKEKFSVVDVEILSSVYEAEKSIQLCEVSVLDLKRRLEKLKTREPLPDLRKKDVLLHGLKGQGRRLLYPFQKGTLGKLRDVISDLRDGLQPFLQAVQLDIGNLILSEVKQIKGIYQKSHFDEETRKVLSWLSPLTFDERYHENLSLRHFATGLWFLNNPKFVSWQDGLPEAPRGLWCVGNMGTGKSVLLATVIERLKGLPECEKNGVLYVFCSWQERATQTARALLGALVKQMAESLSELPPTISNYYKAYSNGKQKPTIKELFAMFSELKNSFDRVYIIADGLDEAANVGLPCQESSMGAIEGMLKTILDEDVAESKISLLISSRFNQEPTNSAHLFDSITIAPEAEELRKFVDSELQSEPHMGTWVNSQLGQRVRQDAKLRRSISEHCLSRADNTYLLPRLHINRLKQQVNLKQLLKAAHMLHNDMSQSIRLAMERIQSQADTLKDIGVRTLFWILKAMRPLQMEELRYALAVDVRDESTDFEDLLIEDFLSDDVDDDDLIPASLIIASCGGLVAVSNQTGIVRLIHTSITQYLGKVEDEWFPCIHSDISKVCISCLSKNDFAVDDARNEYNIRHWLHTSPFLAYSLQYWGHHACVAPEEKVLKQTASLLSSSNRVQFLFRGLYAVSWETLHPCSENVPAMFLAAYFGLTITVKRLLIQGRPVDDCESFGRTALHVASALGHIEIVKILLEYGADVSGRKAVEFKEGSNQAWWLPPWARDDSRSHALCVAAESGHTDVVRMLIEHDAKIDAIGSFQDGALEGATFGGHIDVVRLLLQHDARITRNTLQCSAYLGYIDILNAFLPRLPPHPKPGKINHNATALDLPRALYAAALSSHTTYAERLLSSGVDPNESTLTAYQKSLAGAASRGHIEMLKLLLRYGAEVNSSTDSKDFSQLKKAKHFSEDAPGTALQAASFAGQDEAVDFLLHEGADVDIQSGYYGTAIQAAAAGGHYSLMDRLLKLGARADSSSGFYGNALQAAASKGSEKLVQMLLGAGANVNAIGGVFGSALQAAAWNGNPSVIQILLDAGADPDIRGGRYGSALQAAAVGCPIVEPDPQLLIPKASSLPLAFHSFTNRRIDMLTLSNMRASLASMMRIAGNSLDAEISERTNKMSASLLLNIERQVLITNEGEATHETLESAQKSKQNVEAVKLLLDAGVNVDANGGRFHTALQAACYAGHMEVVNILLERGADIHASFDEADFPWHTHDALRRAVDSGHTIMVKQLLERGADATVASAKTGVSVLHVAAKQNEDIVDLLLKYGAETDKPDNDGVTPILNAANANKLGIVKLLIQKGADVNISLEWGHPLHAATESGQEMMEAILDAGANLESINMAFRSLLERPHLGSPDQLLSKLNDMMRLLLDHGANVNVGSTISDRDAASEEIRANNLFPPNYAENLNPLSIASSQLGDVVELVQMLVDAGADLEKYGEDALWLATMKKHVQIREYLRRSGVQAKDEDK